MSSTGHSKTVFITGASSGIGAAIARAYARRGFRIAIAARRVERLNSLKPQLIELGAVDVLVICCDVTQSEDLVRAYGQINTLWGRLDRVYANAGYGVVGDLNNLSLEDFRRQFETNVFGVLETARLAFGGLKASGGSLALVGSMMSSITLPGTAPYAMSKAAVQALAEALWIEWGGAGVSVTLVSPGFVESEIREVDNSGVYRPGKGTEVPRWLILGADAAAQKIVAAVEARRREVIVTWHAWLALLFLRACPGCFYRLIRLLKVRGRPSPDV